MPMYEEDYKRLLPVIQSKVEEFKLFGYGHVEFEEIWAFLCNKKWKKEKSVPPLHQAVNDVLSTKISDVMNYMTMESFKSSASTKMSDLGDLSDLFS
ncbi:post-transcriptional regulator [Priestia koreensis]|uniref:post-transcriptional regulator n=1 Tax=Priestia koreensis TaxID=284581 RepID=UPI001F55D8ED|nr:post-transcriptional regulator [Priestia koreensis]UNL84319.1 post-transcriptional regulator [Priestia koreensis]